MENNETIKTSAEIEAAADSISAKKEEDPKEMEKNTSFIIKVYIIVREIMLSFSVCCFIVAAS